MKIQNYVVLYLMLSLTMQSISAKPLFKPSKLAKKQRIYLSNEYGDKVSVTVEFGGKSWTDFSRSQTEELREEDEHVEIVAPFSGYKLTKLTVTPVANTLKDELKQEVELLTDHKFAGSNEDTLDKKRIGNNSYFIIQASQKDSSIPGQKKIVIKGFASQEECDDYKNNNQPAIRPESTAAMPQPQQAMPHPHVHRKDTVDAIPSYAMPADRNYKGPMVGGPHTVHPNARKRQQDQEQAHAIAASNVLQEQADLQALQNVVTPDSTQQDTMLQSQLQNNQQEESNDELYVPQSGHRIIFTNSDDQDEYEQMNNKIVPTQPAINSAQFPIYDNDQNAINA